ncbi:MULTISPECIES: photosynthesis system II assembly factor Ycf48 [Prochlorococcus]|uniref:Photosystem II assembly lipoprotein Ycf48 n=1 Tax=Prochlorococcus marinus (strain SARG / CCMP1375 / SS120) TaxID=167539 RepID=YCF48_PROMA|nr:MULTISPECIES: photosynthesis system II assembly factor Ycf48 [Prochlorococcus]Q7VDP1.1 RecName: Full=Photosystem II assembly lipoprotein Ycf48; Flags: Precursor [Prochlorococcus marinus subsp. marinus str. CCMP1375]AAP99373.1 Photosystem II stability/assembly factor [Prochlorococcus marinus subsp. marinus str. CCMP1375]KGG11356.1 Photosystem II stability/assembly factor [Prochlorococcus marinus str. LG]KGG18689.1 Photosystem II stability/assembly factor [Prochlorococcus marinus str. SS2]KGG
MNRLIKFSFNLILIFVLGLGLSGCVTTTRIPVQSSSPWEEIELANDDNPLDIAFVDDNHGFLVGANRLILETTDGGSTWEERDLDIPAEENFRLMSIDFKEDEGWIVGQPNLVLHSEDAGKNWTRLSLGSQLPGNPYLITTLDTSSAELATTAGAVYRTTDGGKNWEGRVAEASGGVRDLRRKEDGTYVSVSSLGNFFVTLDKTDQAWQSHQRASSKRVQTLGFKPDGQLWMLSRGAEIRLNDASGDYESWSKPIIPLVNGYNYMDMAWDPEGNIWAGGGNGTLLVSKDDGNSWEKDPIGYATPTNFIRIFFLKNPNGNPPKGFVLGERGHVLRWVGYS